ncbi:DUF2283 domain-containing protein [Rhodoplanes roseus]|uniref:DUF2283 domain-containing protein n=1 Tax=Rhodoplanes roseus TaxID=29409 RepID=A0A327KWA1_9BRAD|nr:DUF2283 domain-containing protein [Rhodoplanes roseus]RAI41502.1 hypothetical protein CH341_21490 [Rhodoplanes roseus]
MSDTTYDPEADAVYLRVGRGKIARQEENGPFICDVDSQGRILSIETLSARAVLAPGAWQDAPLPRAGSADAAE